MCVCGWQHLLQLFLRFFCFCFFLWDLCGVFFFVDFFPLRYFFLKSFFICLCWKNLINHFEICFCSLIFFYIGIYNYKKKAFSCLVAALLIAFVHKECNITDIINDYEDEWKFLIGFGCAILSKFFSCGMSFGIKKSCVRKHMLLVKNK